MFRFVFFVLFVSLLAVPASACEMCTVPQLGKEQPLNAAARGWFVNYTFEQSNWHEKEGGEGHAIHHQGRHFHSKTHEDISHLIIGKNIGDATLQVDIPYASRHLIEVDDHSIIGTKQTSEGLGDLFLIGKLRIWGKDDHNARIVAGVKFPTGETNELNSIGTRFEPELQPGTGSDDYLFGAIYERDLGGMHHIANAAYFLKTEGTQNFEMGDVVSLSLESAFDVTKTFRVGLTSNLQHEQKQKDHGDSVEDSGGIKFLMGPVFHWQTTSNTELSTQLQLPVYQNLGGVHQELDLTWHVAGKLGF